MISKQLFFTILFIVLFILSSNNLLITCLSNHNNHVSTKWKSSVTNSNLKAEWLKHDLNLHQYLSTLIPEALPHTGSTTFDDHLKGVQTVLRAWNSPEYLCDAGEADKHRCLWYIY